jgi:DNA repair exonuclease SbcCD nuclease subunit
MPAFSFIHVSDLYLDSPLRGLSSQPPAVAEVLRTATLDAFERLIRLCLDKDVSFLLIAGDAIQGEDRNLRAQIALRDGLARLAERGIQTFIALGDRDPRETWSAALEWPQGVHFFGEDEAESVTAERHGAALAQVTGVSRKRGETRDLASLIKRQGKGLFQVALLHGEAGAATLSGAGIDYWALGGAHNPRVVSRAPLAIYPGALQGLSAEEAGAHGCALVTVGEDRRAEMEFIAVDAVRWTAAEAGIGGLKTGEELSREIATRLEEIRARAEGRPSVATLALTGRGALYYELSGGAASRELLERARKAGTAAEPLVWVRALEPRCLPEMDLELRGRGQDMVGQVLTVAGEWHGGDLEEKLGPVLAPLFEDTQARRALEALAAGELQDILNDAQHLCLDQLEKSE